MLQSTRFIRKIAGLDPNPQATDISYFEITPHFIDDLSFAEAEYESAFGKVFVKWERDNEKVILKVTAPSGTKGKIKLPYGFKFDDGLKIKNWKKQADTQSFTYVVV